MTTIMERKQMTKHIVMLFGASGSGKDTVANYLEDNYLFIHRKFAAPMKRFVEQCYGLRPNELDTQEGKNRLLKDVNSDITGEHTFADLLVGAYHFWQQFDDAMTARGVARDIEDLTANTPWNVVISDCRKLCEAQMLHDFISEQQTIYATVDEGVRLHIICVGGRGAELSSDAEQKECVNILKDCCYSIQYINNKFDIKYLTNLVDTFVKEELQ